MFLIVLILLITPMIFSLKYREKGDLKRAGIGIVWYLISWVYAVLLASLCEIALRRSELSDVLQDIMMLSPYMLVTSLLTLVTLYTISILTKRKLIVRRWSLGIAVSVLLVYVCSLGYAMFAYSTQGIIFGWLLPFSVLIAYPIYAVVLTIAITTMLLKKRRQTKRLQTSE